MCYSDLKTDHQLIIIYLRLALHGSLRNAIKPHAHLQGQVPALGLLSVWRVGQITDPKHILKKKKKLNNQSNLVFNFITTHLPRCTLPPVFPFQLVASPSISESSWASPT